MQVQTMGAASLRRALLAPFTTLSLGAAAIHFAVMGAHFQDWWAFGLFMASIAWFQALWPIAYVLVPSPRVALLGALVNLGTTAVWAWSRFAGLPIGPGSGKPMPVGVPDLLATAFEVLLVVGLVLFSAGPIRRGIGRRRLRGPMSAAWSAIVVVIVAITTSAAITVGMTNM